MTCCAMRLQTNLAGLNRVALLFYEGVNLAGVHLAEPTGSESSGSISGHIVLSGTTSGRSNDPETTGNFLNR